jgi:uracil-DNA glycosylase
MMNETQTSGLSLPIKPCNDWDEFFAAQGQFPYFKALIDKLQKEYTEKVCYPPCENIFNAFIQTPFSAVRAVILGQDPYHGENQATGLAFDVPVGVKPPPSLKNIIKEVYAQTGEIPDIKSWAKQGILLLNTCLTVEKGKPNSHENFGWKIFTDAVLTALNDSPAPKVFMLWGEKARNKGVLLSNPIHLKLCSAHPSPLSANKGFFGNNHFLKMNEFLKANYGKAIKL